MPVYYSLTFGSDSSVFSNVPQSGSLLCSSCLGFFIYRLEDDEPRFALTGQDQSGGDFQSGGKEPHGGGRYTPRASRKLDAVVSIAIFSAPTAAFAAIIAWFSQNPISPNPSVEASAGNLVGLLTSNFVYDGQINIENIAASSVFLVLACLYFPRRIRLYLLYLVPFVSVGAGALAELTAISSPYANLPWCTKSCSFYGMSGVASAMIGFTFASFVLAFAFGIFRGKNGQSAPLNRARIKTVLRGQTILLAAFAIYVLLLLVFSGLIALPSVPSSASTSGPSPPAILTQTPPVLLVHSASLFYGFLLCLATFVQLNRRYRVFGSRPRQGPD